MSEGLQAVLFLLILLGFFGGLSWWVIGKPSGYVHSHVADELAEGALDPDEVLWESPDPWDEGSDDEIDPMP